MSESSLSVISMNIKMSLLLYIIQFKDGEQVMYIQTQM